MKLFFKIISIIFILCCLIFTCCNSGLSQTTIYSKEQLITCAMELFKNKKYSKSILFFIELRKIYPYSKYDALANLKVADAYLALNKDLEAIDLYSDFNLLYFYNEGIPYSIYALACVYFDKSNSSKNDQVYVRKALKNYIKIVTRFSRTNYAISAKTNIFYCYKRLSEYEFNLGIYFFNKKDYLSASARFLKVISFYPDVGFHKSALVYLFESEKNICNFIN